MVFVSSSLLAQDEEYMALKATSPPTIDGDLGDWALVEGIYLDEWEEMNLVIFSGEELAVSPRGKMTATWGDVKTR